MKSNRLIVFTVIVSLMLACNASLGASQASQAPAQSAAAVPPSETPAVPATGTPLPLPADTPTSTPTPTSSVAMLAPRDKPVNCRFGPGTVYVSVGSGLAIGSSAQILGKSADGGWWQIQDPSSPGQKCWVGSGVTNTTGDLSTIPVVAAPPAVVTAVTASASVSYLACGGPNVIVFSGSITTNGPATVTFRWEVRGDKKNTDVSQKLIFSAAGTKNITSDSYKADCGKYSITLHVLSPNDISGTQKFTVP